MAKRLIDANALYIKLGKLGREPDYQHEGENWSVGVAMAMGEVWSEPTVDAVEVVHGRWVHPKGYVVSNGFLCSECNHEVSSYHVIHPLGNGSCKADEHGNFFYPPKINYCPNCGAKMDGDGDG